ncbi:MAG: tyrosine-type recombinase/integrase [Terracidiphilus sp.]
MGKATYGTGSVILRGKKWYGYPPRDRTQDSITGKKLASRKPIVLGLKSKMTKSEARDALAREIAKRRGWFRTNGQIMNDGSVTLNWFCKNRYFPLKESDWKEETAKIKKALIQTNILDDLGKIQLNNFDRFTLQMQINKLAKICSKDTVLQMRAYLRDMFAEAVDQDFLFKDTAARVKVPPQPRETDKTTLTWDQLRMALEVLYERDRILLELDMTDALRPGELFALRWKCFDPEYSRLVILETVYKGNIRPWGKTRKSLAPVHLPPVLVSDLKAWKANCPDSSPDAFIFPNDEGGFLDSGNYRKRVLHQLAEILNLSNLTFQIIRRTIATLSQTKGSVKATQGLLRHARTPTTTDVYMQVIPEGVEKMVDSIHDELRKPSKAAAETSKIRANLRAKNQRR